jgi:hypothetical protein
MRELEEVTAKQALLADGVIAAGLPLGGRPGRALDERYDDLRHAVARAFPERGEGDDTWLRSIVDRGLTPTVETDYERWKPLHWVLAVPDVMSRGGFDAIIGNPPFLGGHKLTGAMGTDVRDWLVEALAEGRRGNADLVAYFFLRAFHLLKRCGTLGLIATNTIAQGQTRAVALDALVSGGFTITRALRSRRWPGFATVNYAAVWGARGDVGPAVVRIADDRPVHEISTFLTEATRTRGTPSKLQENAGQAFEGFKPYGMGFVVDKDTVDGWIASDPSNASVLFKFLSGDDVNSDPTQAASRWIIDFNDASEVEASKYLLPFAKVLTDVRPERMRVKRSALRDRWWQYGEKRPALRRAITALDEVLVIVKHSHLVMVARVPARQVFSHALAVFATDSYGQQAILSSGVHRSWAMAYGSTLGAATRYTASQIYETFPRPPETSRLRELGKELDVVRQDVQLRRVSGLLDIYRLVNDASVAGNSDPDIHRLRHIHVEIDEAVLEAYGWDDIALDHGFHTYRQMTRWTFSPEARIEILDRLLEENHRRAATQGTAPEPAADEADDLEDAE